MKEPRRSDDARLCSKRLDFVRRWYPRVHLAAIRLHNSPNSTVRAELRLPFSLVEDAFSGLHSFEFIGGEAADTVIAGAIPALRRSC